jgi:hypothetical protein
MATDDSFEIRRILEGRGTMSDGDLLFQSHKKGYGSDLVKAEGSGLKGPRTAKHNMCL